MSRVRLLYFGTPEFSRIVLEELLKSGFEPAVVITAPDKPVGRKQVMTESPVAAFAKANGVGVLKPEKIKPPEFIEQLRSFESDLIIVAAYGKIIPQAILDIPKHGAINVHPSLLPRWRGASPIPYTILNGDTKTGVTIMLMDAEVDHGPILAQEEIESRGDETTAALTPKLARIGGRMLAEVIPRWIAGNMKPTEQDHADATFTKILTKEDGRIDWSKGAIEIERQVRAFDPWPGAWTEWRRGSEVSVIKFLAASATRHSEPRGVPLPEAKNLEVHRDSSGGPSSSTRDDSAESPQNDGNVALSGTVTAAGVITGDGLLEAVTVQLAGKRVMNWSEFLRGHKDFVGSVLK
ncbi:methionyl-tRNA formyltransferase [Candidatus Parcubacteria bacterium]|nr:methionyl-tRNA formyltransferase [Candidatus Parcubacteria bacterium]